MNWNAIDAGAEGLREVTVDPAWSDLTVNTVKKSDEDDYFTNYVEVIGSLDGYDLPVSKFMEYNEKQRNIQRSSFYC